MNEVLELLSLWIARNRPELIPRGRNATSSLDHSDLPDELREWFLWADPIAHAAPSGNEGCFLREWRLLDRATSEALRAKWYAELDRPIKIDGWWHRAWVPLFESASGDLLVCDLEGVFDVAGSVLEIDRGAPLRHIRAENLSLWLDGLLASLDANAWNPFDDGLWHDELDAREWENFGYERARYPRTIDIGREREPIATPASSWIDAWREAALSTAAEHRWESLPHGWCALRVTLGATLDDTLARLSDAPPTRRAIELARLSATLSRLGDARSLTLLDELFSASLDALSEAVPHLDFSDPTLRHRFEAHAASLASERAHGAAMLCASLGCALAPYDLSDARAIRSTRERLTPSYDTSFAVEVMCALFAARCGDDEASYRVEKVLRAHSAPSIARDDAWLGAAIIEAHARTTLPADRLDPLWKTPCAAALIGLRTLVALGHLDVLRQRIDSVDEKLWRAALLLALANALAMGDREGERARSDALALAEWPDDLPFVLGDHLPSLAGELRRDVVHSRLRAGRREEALALLDKWTRDAREAVSSLAAKTRARLDAQDLGAVPRRRASTPFDALMIEGRIDEALAIARDPQRFSSPSAFVELVVRLVRMGRRDDALTLCAHLVRHRTFRGVMEVAEAVAVACPESLPALRAQCDALR